MRLSFGLLLLFCIGTVCAETEKGTNETVVSTVPPVQNVTVVGEKKDEPINPRMLLASRKIAKAPSDEQPPKQNAPAPFETLKDPTPQVVAPTSIKVIKSTASRAPRKNAPAPVKPKQDKNPSRSASTSSNVKRPTPNRAPKGKTAVPDESQEDETPSFPASKSTKVKKPTATRAPKGKAAVPAKSEEDETPSFSAPNSIKVVRPNTKRGQPNKIERVQEVMQLAAQGPLTDLQKDPSKLKKFMKRPEPGKKETTDDSSEDFKERPAQKPTVIKVTPSGGGDALKIVKPTKRGPSGAQKRPTVTFEKKPAYEKKKEKAAVPDESEEVETPSFTASKSSKVKGPTAVRAPKGKTAVPAESEEDDTPSFSAPNSIKVVRPNTKRGQPNKIERVQEVMELAAQGPLTDLQKDPSKLKKFMKRPEASKKETTDESSEDFKERPAQKPTVIKVTPSGGGDALKIVKPTKRGPSGAQKRPTVTFEKKPAYEREKEKATAPAESEEDETPSFTALKSNKVKKPTATRAPKGKTAVPDESQEDETPSFTASKSTKVKKPTVTRVTKGKATVPAESEEDETPSFPAPNSIKVVRPNTKRGQPNKIERVQEVMQLAAQGPLTDLQKDPSKLKKFMKRPEASKKETTDESSEDFKERPAQKPTVIKVTPSGGGDALKIVKPTKRGPSGAEKRPTVTIEKKPAKIPKPVKVLEERTIIPEDCSSEEQLPISKPQKVHPVQADQGYDKKERPVLSKPKKPFAVKDMSADYSSEAESPSLKPTVPHRRVLTPKKIRVSDRPIWKPKSIIAPNRPKVKPKKFRVPDYSSSASGSWSAETSCSGSSSKEGCESSEEWDRYCGCGYWFDPYGSCCGSCDSSDSCESGSTSCDSSDSCESGSSSCDCCDSCESYCGSCDSSDSCESGSSSCDCSDWHEC